MSKKNEPWYLHAGLIVMALVLVYILIQVAVVSPKQHVANEAYWKQESHARMDNLRQAEIIWFKKHEKFTDNIDSLVNLLKTDSTVAHLVNAVDTITNRKLNPFIKLASVDPFISDSGDTIFTWNPDSLFKSPRSFRSYSLKVDTTVTLDSIINRRGKLVKVDTNIVIGTKYLLTCPDEYGTVGDLYSDALRNAASWE
ncbi:MAG: hypothetical protein JEY94_05315 [Melioribacteraceae bacterium]|nr:hypothetical protein [Melioribacteraceae bacterium]